MATLEVHNGQGRVERVTVSREQTVMFGSSPKCEIVLAGEGIVPFHGRIRWRPQKNRFKVDASPDAEYVLVNGHKMSSSSLKPGDEIEVGGNRIFLIHDEDHVPAEVHVPARDDATRVQKPTFLAPPAAGTIIRRGSHRRRPEPEELPRASLEEGLDSVVAELEVKPREAAEPNVRPGRASRAEKEEKKKGGGTATVPAERGWKRLIYLFSKRAAAPGQEEVLSSPLVFGLFVALVCLVLVGTALYAVIVRTAASRLYAKAVENLDDGDYRNAIQRFDEFIAANPDDPRTGPARVHRGMANVKQYTNGPGASWSLALEAEREMLETVGQEEAFRDSSSELDEQVLKTGEALADRARASVDTKVLAEAESTKSLHQQLAGPNAEWLLKRSRLPAKLDAAKAAIRKFEVRTRALAAMDAALKGSSSSAVYAARDALVAGYSDQAEDKELLARMNKANDLIRKAVSVDASGRPAETVPLPDPLGPPTSLVIRSAESGAPSPARPGSPLVFALADGVAYGLDGASGAPVWQRPLGLSTPFSPLAIPGGTSILAVDARHDELLRLDGKTGSLVWRQALGEPVSDPPLVLGNQVIQPLPSGKLLLIDVTSGALQATVNLGMPLSGTPVGDETGRALYVTGRRDCLFVLTRDPLECAGVVYLGHDPGSIACSPARIGRYLIVPENHAIDEGRWRVFVLNEDGTKLTPVQQVPVPGWTWGTPAASGAVVWSTSDRGGISAFAVGAYGEKEPFRLIARINPDSKPSGPAFALARSEREIWVGSGRSGRYELDLEGSKVSAPWTMGDAGPALAPPQAAGRLVVLTQEDTEGPGASVLGIDPQSGAVKWRTVLGAPWPAPPTPGPGTAGESLTALGADGGVLTIKPVTLTRGGFVTSTFPRPGGFRLPVGSLARLDGEGWTVIVPALGEARLLVRPSGASGSFQEVRLPAPVGARPVAWGREMLLPGGDGRAYLVDPLTGQARAEPFIPSFDRTKPTRWRGAVALGPDAVALADDAGRVRRMTRVNDPRPRLVASGEIALGKPLLAEPASSARAVVLVTTDSHVRALASRDLSPVGAWNLDAALAAPPAAASGMVFVTDLAGGVLALGEGGQRLWSIKLPGRSGIVGSPAVADGAVFLLTRDGALHVRALADGSEIERRELGVLPAGGPFAFGNELVIPAGSGTLRLVAEKQEDTAPAEPPAKPRDEKRSETPRPKSP